MSASATASLLTWLLGLVAFVGLSASVTAWFVTRRWKRAAAEAARAESSRAASAWSWRGITAGWSRSTPSPP